MTTLIRKVKVEDFEEVNQFLLDNYYGHEPLLPRYEDYKDICNSPEKRANRLSIIQQGLSLIAIDQKNQIVGVVLAEQNLENTWQEVAINTKPKTLYEHEDCFIGGLKHNSHIFEKLGVKRALYLYILTVAASVRNQGMGRRLVEELIKVGRNMHYPAIISICTNFYSTRAMLALGMTSLYSENYADYKDEDGKVVFQPPEPHTAINIMAMKLYERKLNN